MSSESDWVEEVSFDSNGLVCVVAQEESSGEVLMVAWANAEALRQTMQSGFAHYFSRSRQALWRKGETSGNAQQVSRIEWDCDKDTLLYRVTSQGPACHTGEHTCFVAGGQVWRASP